MRFVMRILAGLFGLSAAAEAQSDAAFAAGAETGQVYLCETVDASLSLAVWIGKIEDGGALGQIFHVQIQPVHPDGLPMVGHAPFSPGSLTACRPGDGAGELLAMSFDDAAFRKGYATWQEAEGGVFTIPVIEAVTTMFGLVGTGEKS